MKGLELMLLWWIKNRFWIKSIHFDWIKMYGLDYDMICGLFQEIFIRNEYKFHTDKKEPKILDLGANIWIATLYFKRLYPGAKIISYEPDKKHFGILQKNILKNLLSDITCEEKAVTNHTWEVTFYSDDKPSFSMSTKKWRMSKIETKVKCVSISQVINNEEIDLLKMDIEWWEFDVLKELDQSWYIKQIKEMIIEYHHNIQNDSMSFWEFISIIEKNGFKYGLNTTLYPLESKNKFQDIFIHAYRD